MSDNSPLAFPFPDSVVVQSGFANCIAVDPGEIRSGSGALGSALDDEVGIPASPLRRRQIVNHLTECLGAAYLSFIAILQDAVRGKRVDQCLPIALLHGAVETGDQLDDGQSILGAECIPIGPSLRLGACRVSHRVPGVTVMDKFPLAIQLLGELAVIASRRQQRTTTTNGCIVDSGTGTAAVAIHNDAV